MCERVSGSGVPHNLHPQCRGDSGGGGYSHADVYTKIPTPSQTSEIFTNKACTIVSTDTFSQLRLNYYGDFVSFQFQNNQ